jgi:hypothetical protein
MIGVSMPVCEYNLRFLLRAISAYLAGFFEVNEWKVMEFLGWVGDVGWEEIMLRVCVCVCRPE